MNNENLDTLNNIIGFGDENADLIFFGIEEGGEWEKNEKDKKLLEKLKSLKDRKIISNDEFSDIDYEFKSSQVYKIIAETLNIKPIEVGDSNSGVIVANIYPLAVKTINKDFPVHYEKLFGIEKRKDYENSDFWKDRKKLILDFLEKKQRKTIICMGKSNWEDFKKVIKPNGSIKEDIFGTQSHKKDRKYYHYTSGTNKVYLVDHPSYGWLLKEHLVELKINKL